jgi:hypothetical protein
VGRASLEDEQRSAAVLTRHCAVGAQHQPLGIDSKQLQTMQLDALRWCYPRVE